MGHLARAELSTDNGRSRLLIPHMEDPKNGLHTPSPAEITKSVEESEKLIKLVAESIRHNNWIKIIALLGVAFIALFNPYSYRILSGNALTPQYWLFFLAIILVLFFLAVFVEIRTRPRPLRPVRELTAQTPIKGLLPFDSADVRLFRMLQREDFARECLQSITADNFHFGVLYGESGVGKTSLIRAAIGPQLASLNFSCLYIRLSELHPVESIRQEFVHKFGRLDGRFSTTSFTSLLAAAAHASSEPLVLILDQFEQFFVHRKQRNDYVPFFEELASWYERRTALPVKVVLSVRSDFDYRMIELLNILGCSLGPQQRWLLGKFDPDQAAEILRIIASEEHIEADENFIRELALELAGLEDGQVAPVNIQIWAQMVAVQGNEGERAFNREAYQRLGGIEGLLEKYLSRTLGARETKSRRDAAVRVLYALTDTGEDARVGALSLDELQERLADTASATEVTEAASWLERDDVRLIVPVKREGAEGYELAHERLIPAIRREAGEHVNEADRANDLLERRVNEWLANHRSPRYLFSAREWWFITRQKNLRWGKQKPFKRELLVRSKRRSVKRLLAIALPVMLFTISQFVFGYVSLERDYGDRVVIRQGFPLFSSLPLLGDQVILDTGFAIEDLAPEKRDQLDGSLYYGGGNHKSAVLNDKRFVDAIRLPVTRGLLLCQVGENDDGISVIAAEVKKQRTYRGRGQEFIALKEIVQGNANASESVLAILIESLKNLKHEELRNVTPALEQVAQVKPPLVLKPMLLTLNDPSYDVRWASLTALQRAGESDPDFMLEPLLAALKDSSPYTQWGAAAALGRVAQASPRSARRIIESLIPILENQDSDVRAAAASALGRAVQSDPDSAEHVIAPLLKMLGDQHVTVRWGAIVGLNRLTRGRPEVGASISDPVLRMLGDENQQVREHAVTTLGRIAQAEPKLAPKIMEAIFAGIQKQLVQPNVVQRSPEFVSHYNFASIEITSAALKRVAHANPKLVLEYAQKQELSRSYVVIGPILAALGESAVADPKLADEILSELLALRDEYTDFIGASAEAFEQVSQVAPKRALDPLLRMLEDQDSNKIIAIRALGKVAQADLSLAGKVVERLLPILEDKNITVRSSSARTLGQIANAARIW